MTATICEQHGFTTHIPYSPNTCRRIKAYSPKEAISSAMQSLMHRRTGCMSLAPRSNPHSHALTACADSHLKALAVKERVALLPVSGCSAPGLS